MQQECDRGLVLMTGSSQELVLPRPLGCRIREQRSIMVFRHECPQEEPALAAERPNTLSPDGVGLNVAVAILVAALMAVLSQLVAGGVPLPAGTSANSTPAYRKTAPL
jgi:hypothetical protein